MSGTEQTKRKDRSSQERVKTWKPASSLEAPEAPEGSKYRWVRTETRGQQDRRNVIGRMRQGYEPVSQDEVKDSGLFFDSGDGSVEVGDLMLMKVPEEIVEQREAYIKDKTDRMERAVDEELGKHDSRLAPLERNRRSTVTGAPVKIED
jgi:hypothetical protein